MNAIFVDTSYILALEVANDQNHAVAKDHWELVSPGLPPLVTTSYVFDEIVTFLNNRGFHAKAVQIGDNLIESRSVELVHVDEALFFMGWDFLQEHRDKRYSLTGCISFVVMQQRDISTAFAFDRHFLQVGFQMAP